MKKIHHRRSLSFIISWPLPQTLLSWVHNICCSPGALRQANNEKRGHKTTQSPTLLCSRPISCYLFEGILSCVYDCDLIDNILYWGAQCAHVIHNKTGEKSINYTVFRSAQYIVSKNRREQCYVIIYFEHKRAIYSIKVITVCAQLANNIDNTWDNNS